MPYMPEINIIVGASSSSRPAVAYVTLKGLRVAVPGVVKDWCILFWHTYSIAKSLDIMLADKME